MEKDEKRVVTLAIAMPTAKNEEIYPKEGLERLGLYVKALREEQGLSQRRAAEKAGMSNSVLWKIERGLGSGSSGRNILSKSKLIQLAYILGVEWTLLKAIASEEVVLQNLSTKDREGVMSKESTEEFRKLLQNEINKHGDIDSYARFVKLNSEEIKSLLSGSNPTREQIKALAKQIINPNTGKNRDIEWLARLAGVWRPKEQESPLTEPESQQHLLNDTTEGGILRF